MLLNKGERLAREVADDVIHLPGLCELVLHGFVPDNQHIRSLAVAARRCPAADFENLIERGLVSEQDLKQMDAEVKRVVVEAAEFATESPEPGVTELYTDIYA